MPEDDDMSQDEFDGYFDDLEHDDPDNSSGGTHDGDSISSIVDASDDGDTTSSRPSIPGPFGCSKDMSESSRLQLLVTHQMLDKSF